LEALAHPLLSLFGKTLLSLRDPVARAEVRAPVAGMVTDLSLESGNSYANRGGRPVAKGAGSAAPFRGHAGSVDH
jgi:hypothetical protein